MRKLFAIVLFVVAGTNLFAGDLFPFTIRAADKVNFVWPEERAVIIAAGEFGDGTLVRDFEISVTVPWVGTHVNLSGTPDEGFWVLVRLDEPEASWSSGGPGEVAVRDELLP